MYQQPTQRKGQQTPAMSQNEVEAKNKLASYVYEYLHQNGAQKAAEMFKSEVAGLPDVSQLSPTNAPGFLYNWWIVFWDIYSATPDRREKGDATQEAKAFADTFYSYGVNGMPSFTPGTGPMPMTPHGMDPIMMNNFYRNQSNPSTQASPVPGYQPNFPVPMQRFPMTRPVMPQGGFPPNPAAFDPRMMPVPARMGAPRGMPFASSMGPMRPMYRNQYLESPTTPTFPNTSMMQNGAPMNGPGPSMNGPMDPNNPAHDPRFQMGMMPGMNPQFPMMMNDPCGAGTPTSSSAAGPASIGAVGSVPPLGANNINGPSSVGSTHGNMNSSAPPDNNSMNNGSLSSLLNGGDGNSELKQSPASVHGVGHMNSGTPLQYGPGSHNNGPGSVQSQINAPNSVNASSQPVQSAPQSYGAELTPNSQSENAILDFQQSTHTNGDDESVNAEISKIKHSLISDFMNN
ncbi:LisH domain-containing protein [Aphelenchoides besseyi]|nr:LisH domain-containing protein [Aphelenchoides besseyi]